MDSRSDLPVHRQRKRQMSMNDRTYTLAECLLQVHATSLAYGEKLILRDVNLNVHNIVRPGMAQGQVVALLGPSGVGKTQLFRCIAGLQKPSEGSISRPNLSTEQVRAGDIGVVFQNYPLMKHRTIWSNLKLAAKRSGAKDEQINMLLDRFKLDDKKDRYPHQLSGGQRQRIAIIQQMICNTHFILMDEPFSGLDVKMKHEVCRFIQEVSVVDELNTTIFTSHDIETACMIADTVWVMGFEKDVEGKNIPGARVVQTFDLIERGLAWNPQALSHPNFVPTVREIMALFMA